MSGPVESQRWHGQELTDPAARWDGAEATAIAVPRPQPSLDDDWHRQGASGPLTGQVFADYEIGAVLGEGGMGTVYRARQLSLGRRVAVKTLSSALGGDPVQRARFEIEARAASLIQNQHVVAVHAAGSWNGTAYFVMEYVEGSDLGAQIEAAHGRGLGHQRTLDYALQAARGLAAAAAQGVVHRDIKPSNLLLTRDGVLKIADFGVSKIAGDCNLTRTGTAVGTPSYLSPEQGRGEPTDARSDLYSLGCVLYETLTGRKPFTGDTADAVIYQHNYAEPVLPRSIDPAIPEPVQALVIRCLQKDPAQRYQHPDQLIRDIDAIRAGDVSVTALLQARYGTGAEEQMRRRLGHRHRWMLPLAAALALAALAGGALLWRQGSAEERQQARRSEELLRQRLHEGLDRIAPVPPGMHDDLAALTRLAGAEDADVRRWRGRLEAIAAITTRLDGLHGPGLPDAARRGAATADLALLDGLIGAGSPPARRAEARLAETAAEMQRLRQALAELDGQADATLATAERLLPALGALARLCPGDDPDLARWRRRLAALDERLAGVRTGLAALDAPGGAVDEPTLDRCSVLLDELLALRGTAPADAAELRWRTRLAAQRTALARLRDSLSGLDGDELPDEARLLQLERELADYAARVLPDEARLLRWQARAAAARRRVDALWARCAPLRAATALDATALQDAREALLELRPLARPQDQRLIDSTRALAEADAAWAGWRAALARLESGAAVPQADLARALAALGDMQRRQGVGEQERAAATARIDAEQAAFAALRRRCAAIDDAAARPSASLAADIALHGRLAGPEDAEQRRWSARIAAYAALRLRLAALDEPAALPATVDADLAALQRMVGDGDPELAAWRGRVARVRTLQAQLSALDRPAAPPADAEQSVDELHALVGGFPQEPAWRAKLARVARLQQSCAALLGEETVVLQAGATDLLDALAAESGETPAIAAWRTRASLLADPGRPAWASSCSRDAFGIRAVLELPGDPPLRVGMRFVPSGRFAIGSPPGEDGRDDDETSVTMVLTRSRWLGETEVSRALWRRVMLGDAGDADDRDLPADRLDWAQAADFCARLSALAHAPVRLPTEAEWEHACRAGGMDPAFAAGAADSLSRCAWYRATSSDGAHAVGRRPPNALGLHDMLGNVWEWCGDRYGLYPAIGATDPQGGDQDRRVVRGGCWADPARLVRAANRAALDPGTRSVQVGLRILIEHP